MYLNATATQIAPPARVTGPTPGSRETGEVGGIATRSGSPGAAQKPVEVDQQRLLDSQVRQLQKVDREVRLHERQHAAAAGAHGGAPQFKLERGPDGVMYAVAGSVDVDLSPVPGDPEATLDKAQQLQRAALAPAEPSSADRSVAMQASKMANDARSEIARGQTGLYLSVAQGESAGEGQLVDIDV